MEHAPLLTIRHGRRDWQVQWEGAGSPLSISATDPAHAWALIACTGRLVLGNATWHTADGGRTWTPG